MDFVFVQAERLHLSGVIGQGDMARLNAYQRQKVRNRLILARLVIILTYYYLIEDPPDCILPYCHTPDDLDLVSRYRVVVSTCVTAGTLYCLGLNVGHFTHVFVDEVWISINMKLLPKMLYLLTYV